MFKTKSAHIEKKLHKELQIEAIIQNKHFQALLDEIIREYLKKRKMKLTTKETIWAFIIIFIFPILASWNW